jgi:hypothetical protein
MKTAFSLCFNKLNMTEGCQPELVEGGYRIGFHNLTAQRVKVFVMSLQTHHSSSILI